MSSAEATKWVRAYLEQGESSDFKAYAGNLADTLPGRFMWLMEHLVQVGKMNQGRILDVGCGLGWQAVATSILARSHVVANDIRSLMTDAVARGVSKIQSQGAPVSVEVLTGDVCALELAEHSFDSIICNQTIEHVHDLEKMMQVSYRLLKPGSKIIITNDNNALNAKQLKEIRSMWVRRDMDWSHIDELKRERPVENRDIQPYAVMREQIVRDANPNLAPDEVQAIVKATAGLTQPEIKSIASNYTTGDRLPKPPELSWCRNPVTGEYCERQLDPYAIAEMMRSLGFHAEIRHGFRRRPLSALNGVRLQPINRLLFQLKAFFIIIGTRP